MKTGSMATKQAAPDGQKKYLNVSVYHFLKSSMKELFQSLETEKVTIKSPLSIPFQSKTRAY